MLKTFCQKLREKIQYANAGAAYVCVICAALEMPAILLLQK
jgi:hypothetical protein